MRGNVQPPFSNTGAERTEKNALKSLVDWVRVVFFDVNFTQIFNDILKIDEGNFVPLDKGRYRYMKSLRCGNIVIYYEGIESNMGIMLEMSGKGCRQFEATEEFTSWRDFFNRCMRYRTNYPRLDLAIDDYKGFFTIRQIDRKISRKEVSSRFKTVFDQGKRSLSEDRRDGKTIQFGSRESLVVIRFYDKLAQMKEKGEEIEEEVEVWNRIEIELKDERAVKAVEMILEGKPVGDLIKGILSNYIRFLVRNRNDSNRRRWKTWRNWERFLSGVSRVKLSVSPRQNTVEQNIRWLEKQVSKTLLKVVMAESMEFIQEMIMRKQESLTPLDLQAIEMHVSEKRREREEREKIKKKIKARLLGEDKALEIY